MLADRMLLNRLQSEVIAIGDLEATGVQELVELGAKVLDPKDLAGQVAKFTGPAYTEYRIFAISEESFKKAELRALLEALRQKGYGIFVYGKEGIQRIFMVTVFASWLGISQFELLMRQDYGIQGRDKQGYFSVAAYLANKAIQSLLDQLAATRQVSVAA